MADEEVFKEIEEGDKDEDIYTEEGRESELDSDAIDEVDEGIAKGYEEDEKVIKCAKCGRTLGRKFVEVEIEGELYNFCSEECAEEYEVKHK